MAVNGFLVDNEVQKYNYESLENYNTPDFSTSSTYQVGDYVMYQGKLYKCTTAITTSGAWDSSKWSLAILSDDVANLRSSVESGEYGLSEPVKQAILQIARKVVYVDDQGQTYYDDLYDALYPLNVVSISAVYTQTGTVYDTDTLDSLKTDLVVTAHYSDSSTSTVAAANYTLSGTLTVGTSTITVSYGGKTDTFTVEVTRAPILPSAYQEVEYIEGANTGTGPYLEIPYQVANGNVIKGKTYIAAKPNTSGLPIDGANSSDVSRLEIGYSATEGTFYFWCNKSATLTEVTGLYGSPVEFEATYQTSYPYRQLKVTTISDEKTVSSTSEDQNHTDIIKLYVFAKAYRPFSGRVYWITVVDESNNTLLNLVPCYRKANSVIGMYDTVSNTFYANAGNGLFTKGGDV